MTCFRRQGGKFFTQYRTKREITWNYRDYWAREWKKSSIIVKIFKYISFFRNGFLDRPLFSTVRRMTWHEIPLEKKNFGTFHNLAFSFPSNFTWVKNVKTQIISEFQPQLTDSYETWYTLVYMVQRNAATTHQNFKKIAPLVWLLQPESWNFLMHCVVCVLRIFYTQLRNRYNSGELTPKNAGHLLTFNRSVSGDNNRSPSSDQTNALEELIRRFSKKKKWTYCSTRYRKQQT